MTCYAIPNDRLSQDYDQQQEFEKRLWESMRNVISEEYQLVREKERQTAERFLRMLYIFVTYLDEKRRTIPMLMKYLKVVIICREFAFVGPVYFHDDTTAVMSATKEFFLSRENEGVLILAAKTVYRYYLDYCADTCPENDDKAAENKLMEDLYDDIVGTDQEAEEIAVTTKFPLKLKTFLDEYVVGQEDAKRVLAMQLYKYIKFGDRTPVLLIGPSGSGKNFLMDTLANCPEMKEVSFFKYDVTQMTENGFHGDDVQDMIKDFVRKKRYDKAVIYLDEIDKVIMPSYDARGDNVHAFIQYQIMNLIAGETVGEVDFGNIQFVLGGAFVELEELRTKKKNTAGFVREDEGSRLYRESELRKELIEIGAAPEFVGRIPLAVQLKRHTVEEIKAIIVHPYGYFARKKQQFKRMGFKLEIEEAAVDALAECVINENLGARSAANLIEYLIGTNDFYMLEKGYNKMIIHEKMVTCGAPPIFEKTRKKRAAGRK